MQQSANVSGPVTYLPPVVFVPKTTLPALSFPFAPPECSTSIAIDGALEGATVTLERFHAGKLLSTLVTCFDLPSADWPLPSPVLEDDVFRATQRLCDRLESPPVDIAAGPAALPPPLLAPVCPGDGRVTVHDLVPGAIVRFYSVDPITQQKTEHRIAGASAETCTFLFDLEGVLALQATQELPCGTKTITSLPSPVRVLGPAPEVGRSRSWRPSPSVPSSSA